MKKIFKPILIFIGILALLLIIAVVRDLSIENELNKIVLELSSSETVDMTIKTSGNYAKVEQLIKKDYQEFYELVDQVLAEYGNPMIQKCLSASNYAKDGPLFTITREELDAIKVKRKEIHNKMLKIVAENAVKDKAKSYKLDDYYIHLYEDYINTLKIEINDVIEEDNKFNDTIDSVLEILDFLGEEKDRWVVEGEFILFDDQDLLDKYNWLIDKICPECENNELTEA